MNFLRFPKAFLDGYGLSFVKETICVLWREQTEEPFMVLEETLFLTMVIPSALRKTAVIRASRDFAESLRFLVYPGLTQRKWNRSFP